MIRYNGFLNISGFNCVLLWSKRDPGTIWWVSVYLINTLQIADNFFLWMFTMFTKWCVRTCISISFRKCQEIVSFALYIDGCRQGFINKLLQWDPTTENKSLLHVFYVEFVLLIFFVFCAVFCFVFVFVFVLCLVCPMLPMSLDLIKIR
jgi:hypothetical protein